MSTTGVESRMGALARAALAANDGVISGDAFNEVVEYARNGEMTAGERVALLNPYEYLSAIDGLDVDSLSFSAEARGIAETLAGETGTSIFPRSSAEGVAFAPAPVPPTAASLKEAFVAAMESGKDLGSYKDWKVVTPGADVAFSTKAAGRDWPALVLETRVFTDPEPARNLVNENAAAFSDCKTLGDFQKAVDAIVAKEVDYFAVAGVEVKSPNETFGIQNLRRKAFVQSLQSQAIRSTSLSSKDKVRAGGVVEKTSIALVDGIDFKMQVGSHTNYWPYWDNYAAPLEKLLDQQEEGSDAYFQIKNRLTDIMRRKTSNDSWGREVDERNFESSINMALIYNPLFSVGVGHRVSVAEGSTPFEPNYELLTVNKENLPEGMDKYAGYQVFRDTDEEQTLKFDYMGDGSSVRAGLPVPEELHGHIAAKSLSSKDLDGLSLREFQANEQPRSDISMDWDSNGAINIARTEIGWWGHCHNEAPMNAMGIDPQKSVSFYRATRGLDTEKALKTYTPEDAWDVAGALVADHEGNPEWKVVGSGKPTYGVTQTSFVGSRNNGSHFLNMELPGGKSIQVDGEIVSFQTDPEVVEDPAALFRESIEDEEGTFGPNPRYVSTSQQDSVTIDVQGATMELQTEYFTIDSSGYPFRKEGAVTLDPSVDEFVKVSESVQARNPGKGGTVIEHHFNAKTEEYKSITKAYTQENEFKGEETDASVPVKVTGLTNTTETEFDSAEKLYDYFMDNPGLPKTYDTESGKAVWNYPIEREKLTLLREVSKDEGGVNYTYRTFELDYDSMGGPDKSQSFILKFNEAGSVVDSCATDPMPDFVFRNDHWVSAPITTDSYGQIAYNAMALDKGYLLRQGGNSLDDIERALWQNEALVLYASLSDETAAGHAYIFETPDGHVMSFETEAAFEEAVSAHKQMVAHSQG